MSVFDDGVLRIQNGSAGSVLHYHLTSRILLFCFLAPLLFLGMAELTIVMAKFQKSSTTAATKAGKASAASKKPAAKKVEVPMNPIDKALGAPAPKKPGKDDKDKDDERKKKPSPTPAYVFAAIFATLYVVGRILEARLIRGLFRRRLSGA